LIHNPPFAKVDPDVEINDRFLMGARTFCNIGVEFKAAKIAIF